MGSNDQITLDCSWYRAQKVNPRKLIFYTFLSDWDWFETHLRAAFATRKQQQTAFISWQLCGSRRIVWKENGTKAPVQSRPVYEQLRRWHGMWVQTTNSRWGCAAAVSQPGSWCNQLLHISDVMSHSVLGIDQQGSLRFMEGSLFCQLARFGRTRFFLFLNSAIPSIAKQEFSASAKPVCNQSDQS